MDQLRDIKGLVQISFPSFWLITWVIALVCLLGIGAFLWFRYKRRKKAQSPREKARIALQNMDFSDAKEAAYLFTHNGYLVLREDALHVKTFEAIVQDLEAYKFKKNVPPLDAELIQRMHAFIREVHHG